MQEGDSLSVSKRLLEYLDECGIAHSIMAHKPAYTAQETAAAQGITGWQVAKSVVLCCDGEYLLVVLQAPNQVDFDLIRDVLACDDVRLATETEMEDLFPGVELGAESPFGNLYDLAVYVDSGLTELPEIVFNAGTHTATIRTSYEDFERLVQPRVIDIGTAEAA
jgi:Ala-tRNA(Pro) deacylase